MIIIAMIAFASVNLFYYLFAFAFVLLALGIVISFNNAFLPPNENEYAALVELVTRPKYRRHFATIQKKGNGPNSERKNRSYLNRSNFIRYGAEIESQFDPKEIIIPLQKAFNNMNIGQAMIRHDGPLVVQGAHQDDKNFAKMVERSTAGDLLGMPDSDWHWVAFGALCPGQFIRIAMGGDPRDLTPFELIPGSLTFMLTNTWHEGDAHADPFTTYLKLFIDCDGVRPDMDLQRYWDLNDRQISEIERQELLRRRGPVLQVVVEL